MPMEFRKALPEELARLQQLARDNIDTHYRSILGSEGVERFLDSGASDRYVEENIGHCIVIDDDSDGDGESDQRIAGFAICKQDLIAMLMVDIDRHREGIGSLLLQHCERELFKNHPEIRLESFEGNTRGNRFYKKNHWNLLQRERDSQSGVNKYIFVKRSAD